MATVALVAEESTDGGAARTVVVVGLGVIGQVHLRTLAEVPGLAVVGVVDPSSAARERARVAGHVAYADLDAVRDPQPDFYVLATPTDTHVDLAERLLRETRADVLSEKPLTDDPASLAGLVARPDADARLRVVNHFAFSPEVAWAVDLVRERGWGPPASVLSVFNDPYLAKTPSERASYVSSWTDSGPNQLGLLARFVRGCRITTHDAVPDGTRSTTRVAFDTGSGVLTSSWHTGDSSKQTSLRWPDERELWLDHTSMTAVALEGGAPLAHLGHDGTLDRKSAHYRAMYGTLVDDPAHPLLSLAFAQETARLLREAHELRRPTHQQAWQAWSGAAVDLRPARPST